MASSFPPGITDSRIPGNRAEDVEWEILHERIDHIASERRLNASQVWLALEMGLAALEKVAPELAEFSSMKDDLAWGYLRRVEPPQTM